MDEANALIVKLRRLLRSRGRSADETDDLIQEAFLRLQVYCRDKVVQQPEAFLVRTALNLSVDEYRRSRTASVVSRGVELLQLADPSPPPDEVLTAQQRLQHLRAGLESLPPRAREAFVLHRFEGYSYAQIAQELEISVSMVEKHIAKATLSLMQWMSRE